MVRSVYDIKFSLRYQWYLGTMPDTRLDIYSLVRDIDSCSISCLKSALCVDATGDNSEVRRIWYIAHVEVKDGGMATALCAYITTETLDGSHAVRVNVHCLSSACFNDVTLMSFLSATRESCVERNAAKGICLACIHAHCPY
jgi:hypothetical protein